MRGWWNHGPFEMTILILICLPGAASPPALALLRRRTATVNDLQLPSKSGEYNGRVSAVRQCKRRSRQRYHEMEFHVVPVKQVARGATS